MTYDGLIFDVDGVLLNSDYNNFKWANDVRRETADELGYEDIGMDTLRVLFETEHSPERFGEVVEQHGLAEEDIKAWEKAVANRKVELVEEGHMDLFDNTTPVLEEISQEYPVAAVSNAYMSALDQIVHHFELDNYLNYWVAPNLSDLQQYQQMMKPRPSMIQDARENIGASNPLMVGDSSSDVQAAENAGIDSVYINRDGRKNPEATYNITGLEQLQEII